MSLYRVIVIFSLIVSLIQANAQEISISTSSATVAETGTHAQAFAVSTTSAFAADAPFTITISGTSDTGDYASISTNHTFPAGTTDDYYIPLTITEDDIVEGNETLIVTLSSIDGGTIHPTNDFATITINDDDESIISITATTQAAEDATNGLFTISSTQPVVGDVNITIGIAGSATADVDYTAISTTATIPDGQSSVTIPVSVISDTDVEGNEDLIITLQSEDNDFAAIDTNADQATVTITDNDVALLSIVATTQAAEDATNGLFTISAMQPVVGDVEITLLIEGSATPDADYTTIATTATIPDGQSSVTIPISVISDTDVEGNEGVIITLQSEDNDFADIDTNNDQATMTITDNDVALLSIVATTQAAEDATNGLFTISATQPVVDDVNITIGITGSATPDADYTAISTSVTIPDGQSSVTIPVNVISDTNVEGNEDVIITLQSEDNDFAAIDTNNDQATVTITDNDVADFDLSSNSINILESLAQNVLIHLPSRPLSNVVLNITPDDVSLTQIDKSQLTFTPSNYNIQQSITITTMEDNNILTEQTSINISVDDNLSNDLFDDLPDKTINVSITDNDSPGYAVSTSNMNITEGKSEQFNVQLSTEPISRVVFDVTINTTDIILIDKTQLTFNVANYSEPQSIIVSCLEDLNLSSENVIITISINDAMSDDDYDVLDNKTIDDYNHR